MQRILGLTVFIFLVIQSGIAQQTDITGLWKGVLYNDTTRQYYQYEIGISKEKNKYYGFSHTWFLLDDQHYFGVKKVKVNIAKDGKIIVEDDGLISNNYPVPPSKGVRQLNVLTLQAQDSIMVLDGPFSTNPTKGYSMLTGHVTLQRKNDYWQGSLVPHLQELGKENELSFVKEDSRDLFAAQKKSEQEAMQKAELAKLDAETKSSEAARQEKSRVAEQKRLAKEQEAVLVAEAKAAKDELKRQQEAAKEAAAAEKAKELAARKELEKQQQEEARIAKQMEDAKNAEEKQKAREKLAEEQKKSEALAKAEKERKILAQKEAEERATAEKLAAKEALAKEQARQKAEAQAKLLADKELAEAIAAQKKITDKEEAEKRKTEMAVTQQSLKETEARKEQEQIVSSAPAARVKERITVLQQTVNFTSDSLQLSLYDNGEVDGDTVSVLLNGEIILAKQGLSTTAIKKTIYIPAGTDKVELVMYAESLGTIPPNTGLLVVRDGKSLYEVRFSGDLQKNASIVFHRKKE